MAYSSTTTVQTATISGKRHFIIDIAETEASSTSEWSISGVPRIGTIVHYSAHITAGTGTTLTSKMGKVTAWTANTDNQVFANPDARTRVASDSVIRYDLSGATDPQKLFGCSGVNTGTNNSITTRIVIIEGHNTSGGLVDSTGSLVVSLGTKIAGEDVTNDVLKVESAYSYNRIATAATTTVKSGAGFLHAITVNTTAAGTITLYDNTAGSGTSIGQLKASVAEQTFIYDVAFSTGLTIVTAAASNITVSYR